jgi:hypothetical protein
MSDDELENLANEVREFAKNEAVRWDLIPDISQNTLKEVIKTKAAGNGRGQAIRAVENYLRETFNSPGKKKV